MSILDTDIKPITKKFLKSKGFIRSHKLFKHKTLPCVIYTCNYPINLRNSSAQPNTAMFADFDTQQNIEKVYFNNIYTERDVEMVLSVVEAKYKNKG